MGNCNTKEFKQFKNNNSISNHKLNKNNKKIKITDVDNFKTKRRLFKIVLLGDSYVGKTSFINRVVFNDFTLDRKPTIGVDFYTKNIQFNQFNSSDTSDELRLQIWDTAGQERYRSISNMYYKNADVIFIMFALDNNESFKNVTKWMSDVKNNFGLLELETKILIILIGTKSDTNKRCVVYSEISI